MTVVTPKATHPWRRKMFGGQTHLEFDDFPARKTDPRTSKISAREFVNSGKRSTIHHEIVRCLIVRGPCTSGEIECDIGRLAHKRMRELERRGYVRISGERTCRVSGKLAIEWSVESA